MIVVVAGVDVQRLWYITSDDDDVNGWCGKNEYVEASLKGCHFL